MSHAHITYYVMFYIHTSYYYARLEVATVVGESMYVTHSCQGNTRLNRKKKKRERAIHDMCMGISL